MIRRGNKYGAKRVASKLAGRMFDSKAERERGEYLVLLEKAGEITSLRFQVTFKIVGMSGMKDKLICAYRADAVYNDREGRMHVEDTKGVATDLYRLKRRLMCEYLGIEVEEVRRNPRGGWTVS